MAQANFHQNQRVFVKPVGTWASIQKIIPHWVKGLDEPLKVSYDLGLGRSFSGEELIPEQISAADSQEIEALDNWRIARVENRCSSSAQGATHPFPGTHPAVMTDEQDWGGWRVPAAEYDRNPDRFEFQARIIASAPELMQLTKAVSRMDAPRATESEALNALVRTANVLLRRIYETKNAPRLPDTVQAETSSGFAEAG